METRFCEGQSSKGNNSKISMQELPFLRSARRLMLINICMKFREDSFRGFQVTERTRFVTDRRTDRRPGKNNMSPNPSGGDIITRVQKLLTGLNWPTFSCKIQVWIFLDVILKFRYKPTSSNDFID